MYEIYTKRYIPSAQENEVKQIFILNLQPSSWKVLWKYVSLKTFSHHTLILEYIWGKNPKLKHSFCYTEIFNSTYLVKQVKKS